MYLTVSNNNFSPAFVPVAQELAELSKAYTEQANTASKTRMVLIGKVYDAKQEFGQRAAESKYLQQGLLNSGWSDKTISTNASAYRLYGELKDNINKPFQDFADAASPTLLYELSRAPADSTVVFDAVMSFKKTGDLPSKSDIKGRLGGFKDNNFESKRSSSSQSNYSSKVPNEQPSSVVAVAPSTTSPSEEIVTVTATEVSTDIEVVVVGNSAEVSYDAKQMYKDFESFVMKNYKTWDSDDLKYIQRISDLAVNFSKNRVTN